ncbi:putative membrane protein [Lasiodiplodia hormozganensis]|uniref:Membrane protein n=1 Tax=Lasiodiplodia hormozganensis TaxID=869390 RepID=A0AA39YKN7_9PEZI|nr:putative membrane protein [Lasiodiplodia hormozganensis]
MAQQEIESFSSEQVVVEKASSNKPLIRGLRAHTLTALERPRNLFLARPFASVWTLYAATYAVANGAESITKDLGIAAAGTIVFASTLAVNIPLGVRKDLRFAQCYGSAAELAAKGTIKTLTSAAVPKAATVTFLIRDALTIFGSFVLPPRVAASIPDDVAGPHAKATFTQMTVPVVSQLVATPVHLLGLSLYDRSGKVALSDRLAGIWRVMPAATAVRCVRIIPAFGLGLLTNREVRWFLHGKLGAERG